MLSAALLLAWAATAQERSVEAYHPRSRSAAELVPIAAAVLGDAGQVVADRGTNQLVLIGPEALVAQALELLSAQDRRPAQFVVHYESQSAEELAAKGVRVLWQAASVGVLDGEFHHRRDGVRAVARAQEDRNSSRFGGMVRVAQGRSAQVLTGSSLPVDIWGRGYAGRPLRETILVDAQRGFEVSARTLPDGLVLVELQPFEEMHRGGGEVAYTHARTEVRVAPGKTVVVASAAHTGQQRRVGVPVLYRVGRERNERVLLLRVEIEEMRED